MQARPYAQMLANVLQSLVRRTDLYNEETGEIMHPLLVEREEKNVLVLVIAGDKGFAGGFNSNIGKAAQRFIDERRATGPEYRSRAHRQEGDRPVQEALSRWRSTSTRKSSTTTIFPSTSKTFGIAPRRSKLRPNIPTLLLKANFSEVTAVANSIISRYERAEIDSVYIVYNEFKSVISQRVVVEKLLPIRKLGSQEMTVLEEMTEEQKEAAGKAAQGVWRFDQRAGRIRIRAGGQEVWHCRCGLHLRPVTGAAVSSSDAAVHHYADLPCAAGVDRSRACSAHDRDRRGDQECRRADRQALAHHEPRASGRDHQRDY